MFDTQAYLAYTKRKLANLTKDQADERSANMAENEFLNALSQADMSVQECPVPLTQQSNQQYKDWVDSLVDRF